jgi:hypothetical protein
MASPALVEMDPSPLLPSAASPRVRSPSSLARLLSVLCPCSSSLCLYCTRQPFHCLRSFFLFNHFSVISYCLLFLHFLLLYLSSFYLFFSLYHVPSPFPLPYIVYLSFTCARSLSHLLLIVLRLRYPSLWYSTSPHHRRVAAFLTATRLLTLAFLTYGAFYCVLVHSRDAGYEDLLVLPVVPALLVRDALALALPACVLLLLRWTGAGGRRWGEVSQFIPYLIPSGEEQWLERGEAAWSEALDGVEKRRGLSESEVARLGLTKWSGRPGLDGVEVEEVCAICLMELEEEEVVRELPACHHTFHQPCVDRWLVERRNSCPLCVQRVEPPPLCVPECSPALPHLVAASVQESTEMAALPHSSPAWAPPPV